MTYHWLTEKEFSETIAVRRIKILVNQKSQLTNHNALVRAMTWRLEEKHSIVLTLTDDPY